MPAVLVAGHGPFTWGRDAAHALLNAIALEAVAEMALGTWAIDRQTPELEANICWKNTIVASTAPTPITDRRNS